MNKVILMGRLTKDPEIRYTKGEKGMAIARYTLAVDRRFGRKDGEQTQKDTPERARMGAHGSKGPPGQAESPSGSL